MHPTCRTDAVGDALQDIHYHSDMDIHDRHIGADAAASRTTSMQDVMRISI